MKLQEANILVVDDEPELREIFAVWLGRTACTVFTAPDGAEALKILESRPIDAIISDIRMPIMDGITLVRRIFHLERHIPSIIFVSGFGDIDTREAHALGVEAMLPKPLGRKQLLTALENALKERRELWQERLPEPPTQSLVTELDTFEESSHPSPFSLGRGGFCILSPKPLREGPISFRITARGQNITELVGEGTVRWYDPRDKHAGIEFCYLEPESHRWVLEAMARIDRRSFIPPCQPAQP